MQRNIIMRIVVMALMLYALVSLATVRGDLRRTESLAEALEVEHAQLLTENTWLTQRLSTERSPEEMRLLAWERLGLVLPGDKVFHFVGGEAESPAAYGGE